MIFDLISKLVTPLIGSLLETLKLGNQYHRDQIDTFVKYLRALAACLDEVNASLKRKEVPTRAGSRLKMTVNDFESKAARLPMGEQSRKDIQAIQLALRQNLEGAIFVDKVIHGAILTYDKKDVQSVLHDLERTSGYLLGIADSLEADK